MVAADDVTTTLGQPIGTIPQPEPGLTVDQLIQRAGELRERLRAEQDATETRTYYSQEMHETFERWGFYRMLQPKAFGGYEMRVPDFYRVITEIARGCPSTGWCLCFGSAHVLNLATLFSAEVQAEVMGDSGHFVAPSRLIPTVRAVPTDTGWVLNGTWHYSSGAPYSTHAVCGVQLPPGEDGVPRTGTALVPRSSYTVLDDWGDNLGMRGSGSHSIRVEDAAVPAGYVVDVDMADFSIDRTVGMAVHGNPMYTGRIMGFFAGELLAVAIGVGRAMLDEYRLALGERKTMWMPQSLRAEDPQYQQWYGEASSMLDAAEAVLRVTGERYHELCERAAGGAGEFTLKDDMRLSSLTAQGGRYATEAVDLLIRTIGSSSLANASRSQRYWRDFSTYRAHAVVTMRENTEMRFGAATALTEEQARARFAFPDNAGRDTSKAGAL